MKPEFHPGDGDRSMSMIWGRYDDSVEFFTHFIQHLAEVRVKLCMGTSIFKVVEVILVCIAKRDLIFTCASVKAERALTSDANVGDIQFFKRFCVFCKRGRRKALTGETTKSNTRNRLFNKVSSRGIKTAHFIPFTQDSFFNGVATTAKR